MPKTIHSIRALKGERAIVATTAYDAILISISRSFRNRSSLSRRFRRNNSARFKSTIEVTLEMMLHHTAAVVRAHTEALNCADLPFAYSHDAYEHIFSACHQLIQAGAECR